MLLVDIKMLQVSFIKIYMIHKISVLLTISRILKRFLRGIIDFYFLKIFFTIYNDEKFKTWKRK